MADIGLTEDVSFFFSFRLHLTARGADDVGLVGAGRPFHRRPVHLQQLLLLLNVLEDGTKRIASDTQTEKELVVFDEPRTGKRTRSSGKRAWKHLRPMMSLHWP